MRVWGTERMLWRASTSFTKGQGWGTCCKDGEDLRQDGKAHQTEEGENACGWHRKEMDLMVFFFFSIVCNCYSIFLIMINDS
jgi:hypothetical protein